MNTTKFLEADKIYLRPFEDSDIDLVYFGKNNEEVRKTLFLFEPLNRQSISNELYAWEKSKESILFTICNQKENTAVGQTALFRIDYISRAAIFYIAIYLPEYRGKGYGKQATELMISYAFDILNLNRLQLHVAQNNPNAIKVYEKAGFIKEGTLRQAMYHNNTFVDFDVMGILRSDYYNKKIEQAK